MTTPDSQKNDAKVLTKPCPICKGIGFHDGKVCVCITGSGSSDVPEFLRGIFGVTK